jgi:hypothetical protein
MNIFRDISKYLFYVLLCCITFGCSNDYSKNISDLELSIKSLGVSVHRLTSMDEVPVDSYIAGQSVKLGTNSFDGILKGLSDERYLNTLHVIDSSMGLYPKDILLSDLDAVNVGGQIQTEREQYTSGFFQPNSQDIYLFPLVADALNIDRDSDVRHTFHHELSSILMRKYRFDMIGFMASNGTDFEYWFDQAKILDSTHIGYYADSKLLEQGLLTYYSQTSPENDYNTYAEIVFSEPKIMSEYCSTYKRIEHKYEHVKAFYLKISADFQPVFDQIACGDSTQALTKAL